MGTRCTVKHLARTSLEECTIHQRPSKSITCIESLIDPSTTTTSTQDEQNFLIPIVFGETKDTPIVREYTTEVCT